MARLERVHDLHAMLDGRRTPLPLAEIVDRLECSVPTAKRAIRALRDTYGAPLVYDRDARGYRYAHAEGEPRFELPGLWFGADELATLVTLKEIIARLEPTLLASIMAPLSRRLEELFSRRQLGSGEASRRVRVISQHGRAPGSSFSRVAESLLSRRRLAFKYAPRSGGDAAGRHVSPQRLVRYRGCWYLDAWCHDREALRSFAVERIADPHILQEKARDVPEDRLDAHFTAAYGIFAGPATDVAILRIAAGRARWVADECWHPEQQGKFLADGTYELRIPYGRPDELILDILRLGPDVEVAGPPELREEVGRRLKEAAQVY